ncbi:hypothetical protein AQJ46_08295 [Streptomyces canus]|uniref:Uncharacterized protein n=1 Tax=Streptomyces canus TaxID=58343 RepID=A0A101SF92_9ACTN|nr:hypothetical protein AQJ46_08295 [Streptomyces canus]
MSTHCGNIRGVAEAAVNECEKTRKMRMRQALSWPAEETYAAFAEKAGLDGGSPERYADELQIYQQSLREFGLQLKNVCAEMDALAARRERYDGRSRTVAAKELDGRLAKLKRDLDQLTNAFRVVEADWLGGVTPFVPPSTVKYFRRESGRSYDRAVQLGRDVTFAHPRKPKATVSGEGDPRPDEPETRGAPPCGHCIWRCPHAPGRSGGPGVGTDPSASDPGTPAATPELRELPGSPAGPAGV